MKKIRVICIILSCFFAPSYLYAMYDEDNLFFKENDFTNQPLLHQNKVPRSSLNSKVIDNTEREIEACGCYVPNFLSCLPNIWRYWKREKSRNNINLLSNEVIWKIADLLDSPDILRLSGTCKTFRTLFNEKYWVKYMSKKTKSYSFLMLNIPLSPISNRKAFFAHLWYSEERIDLAARLDHPEALMLKHYAIYGAWIGKDQYLCPSGDIKYISGHVDHDRTNKLKNAIKKKTETDVKKNNEKTRRQEVQFIKFNSRGNVNLYN